MKNTFKLLAIAVLGCVCINSSDAMNERNQGEKNKSSLVKSLFQAAQVLEGIPEDHPVHQNFTEFFNLVVLYSQSSDKDEKAKILKEMEELKNQVDQM